MSQGPRRIPTVTRWHHPTRLFVIALVVALIGFGVWVFINI